MPPKLSHHFHFLILCQQTFGLYDSDIEGFA